MDLLLRFANGRTLLILFLGAGALTLAARYRTDAVRKYYSWRYPPQKGSSPLGAEILRDLEDKDRLRIEALHRGVLADLAQAKSQGFEVTDLEARAGAAVAFNTPRTRADAERLLNEVRRDIPIKASENPVVQDLVPQGGR